jgi:hypothetical protein
MMLQRAIVAGSALAFAGMASADVINISGDLANSTGMTGCDFFGTVEYNFDMEDMGTLTVSLTNDTPPEIGGFITGFLFNILSDDPSASAMLTGATDPDFLGVQNENGAPFGRFDAGAALGADWEGGGNPNFGIAVGVSEMFTFKVTASDASSLSAIDFVGDGEDVNFVVRFRGLLDGGSDKVPGVPAPGAGVLALAGLAIVTRRRR